MSGCAESVSEDPTGSAESRAAQAPAGESSPAAADRAAAGATQLTVVAGGDVLLHEPTWVQADADAGVVGDDLLDFAPMLAGIEPIVSVADLALCHLETPLAPVGGPYVPYPSFAVPPQIVPALAATGFDACSGASNHTFDHGLPGVQRTVEMMRAGGLPAYGIAQAGEPPNPSYIMVGAVRVGLLSYSYGSNAAVPMEGIVELLDPDDVAADARTAREAGADIVIASLHWGTEYEHEPDAQQREVATALAADPDIDLILGHHAHVVQPVARVLPEPGAGNDTGTWVAYGLGNMIAAQSTDVPANREGVLARFTFTLGDGEWQVTEAAYLPIFVEREPAVRLVTLTAAGGTSTADTDREVEALARIREVVRSGSASDGLLEIASP